MLQALKEQELRALSTAELNEARIYVQVLEEKMYEIVTVICM
jgi:hypothetical protein